jgi:hypothetical protein
VDVKFSIRYSVKYYFLKKYYYKKLNPANQATIVKNYEDLDPSNI